MTFAITSAAYAAADAEFVEGGFCYSIAREKFRTMPTFAENHANF